MSDSDNKLLKRYVVEGDQAAFEELIRKHSGMVLGVCKSLLWRTEDAEDVFQAVFLLLSIKANKLAKHNSVGGWLHEAAFRISLKHRGKIVRQREVAMQNELAAKALEPWQSIAASRDNEMLHREISKLPKRYRDVIVLCHLEGRSRDQAAATLNVSLPSVKASLSRGRDLLRRRLIKQGVAITAAFGAIGVSQSGAMASTGAAAGSVSATSSIGSTSVSESLIQSTLQHCQGQTPNLTIGTGSDVVHSLIAKDVSIMSFGLTQTSIVATASIVTACAFSLFAAAQPTVDSGDQQEIQVGEIVDASNQENQIENAQQVAIVQDDQVEGSSETIDGTQNSDAPTEIDDETEAPEHIAMTLGELTVKSEQESWDEYVERLAQLNYMNQTEVTLWKAGEKVEVDAPIRVTKMRETIQTRYYPVERTKEKLVDGKTVTETWVEYAPKTIKTQEPITEPSKGTMILPIRGTKPDVASFQGFIYPRNRSTYDAEGNVLPPALETELEIGDPVRVRIDFETKIKKEKVDKVVAGELYFLQGLHGPWCSVEGVAGWLPLRLIEKVKIENPKQLPAEEKIFDDPTEVPQLDLPQLDLQKDK